MANISNRTIKRQIKQLRKERDQEIKTAREAQRVGDFDRASAHTREAIGLERSALKLERYRHLKTVPLTELPGVKQMEKRK